MSGWLKQLVNDEFDQCNLPHFEAFHATPVPDLDTLLRPHVADSLRPTRPWCTRPSPIGQTRGADCLAPGSQPPMKKPPGGFCLMAAHWPKGQ
jgi:hypothetical protein